jgi:hypothetical protein
MSWHFKGWMKAMQLIALQTLQALQKISHKNITLHIALQNFLNIAPRKSFD